MRAARDDAVVSEPATLEGGSGQFLSIFLRRRGLVQHKWRYIHEQCGVDDDFSLGEIVDFGLLEDIVNKVLSLVLGVLKTSADGQLLRILHKSRNRSQKLTS